MLDKLIKISTLSGGFLIFCGVLKLIFYYSYFNITIIDFLSFTEIITSFLDDVNILLIYGTVMTIITFMILNFLHKTTGTPIDELFAAMMKFAHSHKWKYIMFFFLLGCLIWSLIIFKILSLGYLIIYVLVFCLLQSLTFLLIIKDEKNEVDIPSTSLVVACGLTIIFAIFLLSRHDYVESRFSNQFVKITTNDSIFECNQGTKNRYLGKTDNFLFIYSDKVHSSMVIPVSQVKAFEFGK